ncbi:MAG: hypothetical protein GF313_15940 [Caldithrix sp.]|nr:hypothetical protein [Caldithrix sp.]
MHYFKVFLIIILLSRGGITEPPEWVKKSIDLTINTQFDSAEVLLLERISSDSTSLMARFYYASVLNSKMTHFENQTDAAVFKKTLAKIITDAEQMLERDHLNPHRKSRIHFYRGSAYGYLGFFQGQNGQWYNALKNGMKSVDDLKTALQLDSTLYDACLGLGVYKYWRSTKLKFLLWLPVVPDQREEGIQLIKKAIEHDAVSKFMAIHQLIYILVDYGAYDEAAKYAEIAVNAYPESQFMYWANAHTYFKMHDYPKAVDRYQRLLKLIESDDKANPMHWLICKHRIAKIQFRMDKYAKAQTTWQELFARNFDSSISDEGRKKLREARTLLMEVTELLSSRE